MVNIFRDRFVPLPISTYRSEPSAGKLHSFPPLKGESTDGF